MSLFDFSSLSVASVASEPAKSESQIQSMVKDVAMHMFFEQGSYSIDRFVQTDTAKFAFPVDIEGTIRWFEVSFVAKKADFDAEKAEEAYNVKAQQARLREAEKARKRAEKAQKARPVANGK